MHYDYSFWLSLKMEGPGADSDTVFNIEDELNVDKG